MTANSDFYPQKAACARRQQQGCINFSELTARAASWSYYKIQFQTCLQEDHKP